MRYLALPTSLLVVACGVTSARGLSLQVTSDPAGGEVWASPSDQPIIYKKGLTPCDIRLGDAGAPFALLIRKPGYFDAYRYVDAAVPAVSVKLASRDDPASWARLPSLTAGVSSYADTGPGWWAVLRGGGVQERITGMPRFVDTFLRWAPDGSGALCRGVAFDRQLAVEGLLTEREEGAASDLWWIPLRGEPQLLWRWHVRHAVYQYFIMSGDFAPDPRWCVHSAAEGEREHLRLSRTDTGESRPIAADQDASLYWPSFSPTGQLIACVREPDSDEEDTPAEIQDRGEEDAPAEIQVMHLNGSGRRTIAWDADDGFRPVVSPDERQVAYVNTAGQVAVTSVSGDGGEIVIDDPRWRPWEEPHWSPDGRKLAVTCAARDSSDGGVGMPGMLYRQRQPDPSRTVWTEVEGKERGFIRACRVVGWHGPNALLALLKGHAARPAASFDRLAVVGLSGELRRVLREPETLLHDAKGSPDGKRVAALGWRGEGQWDVYLYDTADETLTNLTNAPSARAWEIAWASNTELWVAEAPGPDGGRGQVIHISTGERRPGPRPPALASGAIGRLSYVCTGGDLYVAPRPVEIGPLRPMEMRRLTYLNLELSLPPSFPAGGDGG
jgi:hypothetical protein